MCTDDDDDDGYVQRQCFRLPNNMMIKLINVFSLSRVIVPNVTVESELKRFFLGLLSGFKEWRTFVAVIKGF